MPARPAELAGILHRQVTISSAKPSAPRCTRPSTTAARPFSPSKVTQTTSSRPFTGLWRVVDRAEPLASLSARTAQGNGGTTVMAGSIPSQRGATGPRMCVRRGKTAARSRGRFRAVHGRKAVLGIAAQSGKAPDFDVVQAGLVLHGEVVNARSSPPLDGCHASCALEARVLGTAPGVSSKHPPLRHGVAAGFVARRSASKRYRSCNPA